MTSVFGLQFALLIRFTGCGHIFYSHIKNRNSICQ